jgi:predicted Fe-S protein YdhL (DUF1289 family)
MRHRLNDIEWPDLELPPINLYSFAKESSPCTGSCKLIDGVCDGCQRTRNEIVEWSLMEPITRYRVIQRINALSSD